MFPIQLPIDYERIKKCYPCVLTIKLRLTCRLDIYFKRYLTDGNKEVLELHFLDNLYDDYRGTIIEHDINKTGVELLYDILDYINYIVRNKTNLISNYNKWTNLSDDEDLDIELWFNHDRSVLLHDIVTVKEFKTFNKDNYSFTHQPEYIEKFMSPILEVEEKD